MTPSKETDDILARLRQEFIETSLECLDSIEPSITKIGAGASKVDADIAEIQRIIHTIKGQGSTFDFPAITDIAHRMEDYMESTATWDSLSARGMAQFSDMLREILERGENPNAADLRRLLQRLPVNAQEVLKDQKQRLVKVLLVMPQSIQRKLVAQELASCGFHVMTASTPVAAITAAISSPPSFVLATQVLEEMTGGELLNVFQQINKTRGCHMALLTSQGMCAAIDPTLPKGTVIIHKSDHFQEDLGRYLMDMGLFGKIS
jgi:chemotaxis protein histidine kinase CheA